MLSAFPCAQRTEHAGFPPPPASSCCPLSDNVGVSIKHIAPGSDVAAATSADARDELADGPQDRAHSPSRSPEDHQVRRAGRFGHPAVAAGAHVHSTCEERLSDAIASITMVTLARGRGLTMQCYLRQASEWHPQLCAGRLSGRVGAHHSGESASPLPFAEYLAVQSSLPRLLSSDYARGMMNASAPTPHTPMSAQCCLVSVGCEEFKRPPIAARDHEIGPGRHILAGYPG